MTPYQKKQNLEMEEYLNRIADDAWLLQDKIYIQNMKEQMMNMNLTSEEIEAALIKAGILIKDESDLFEEDLK